MKLRRYKKKRGSYRKYTSQERAEIGRYASANGIIRTVYKYSKQYEGLNESTVCSFKKAYNEKRSRKRQACEENQTLKELRSKKRGRPVLLGKQLDDMVR